MIWKNKSVFSKIYIEEEPLRKKRYKGKRMKITLKNNLRKENMSHGNPKKRRERKELKNYSRK